MNPTFICRRTWHMLIYFDELISLSVILKDRRYHSKNEQERIEFLTIYLKGYKIKGILKMKEAKVMQYDVKIQNRLKRIEGQIKGILRMMDDEKECKDVITQLTAARSAMDRTIGVIVSSNLIDCIQQADGEEAKTQEEIVKEAVDLLVKSR